MPACLTPGQTAQLLGVVASTAKQRAEAAALGDWGRRTDFGARSCAFALACSRRGGRGTTLQASDRADRYPVVHGRVEVASWLVPRVTCPDCGRDRCHLLTAADHLKSPGKRHWRSDGHGKLYFVRVQEQTLAAAQDNARTLTEQQHVRMWGAGQDDCEMQ